MLVEMKTWHSLCFILTFKKRGKDKLHKNAQNCTYSFLWLGMMLLEITVDVCRLDLGNLAVVSFVNKRSYL